MIFTHQPLVQRPRTPPVAFSLAAHGAILAFLMVQSIHPEPRQNAYQQLIAGHENKVLWYKFRDKLPDVQPERKGENKPPKAEVKLAKQNIISSPKDAPKARQMVWLPVPDIQIKRDTPAPNVLAAKLPDVAPPVKKAFTPPAPRRVEQAAVKEMPAAPEIQARATAPVQFQFSKAYRPFVPPAVVRSVPKAVLPELQEAPALAAQAPAVAPGLNTGLANVRRPFTAPPAAARPGGHTAAAPGEMPAAPQIAAAKSAWNGAIVGLDPSDTLEIPKGSRAASFSAGPTLNPNGGTPASEKGTVISVPDLYVKGGAKDGEPTIVARTTLPKLPTSVMNPETLKETSRYMKVTEIGRPSGTRVASVPDARFNGRQVYTVAVQMPNITSYAGSWLMWYSERTPGRYQDDPVSAPMPTHKVDPKYVATAVEERIQGSVRLACLVDSTGQVTQVELVRGLDARLDSSALEAFRKWQFEPATRNGRPVAVDLLVDIPFRLAPRVAN